MGPKGITPMLLVFGAPPPRPVRTTPSPNQLLRKRAVEEARQAAENEQAKRRVAVELPSGSKAEETSHILHQVPAGAKFLVYRTKARRWEGPSKFISADGATVVVQLNRVRRISRSTYVKPWIYPVKTTTVKVAKAIVKPAQ